MTEFGEIGEIARAISESLAESEARGALEGAGEEIAENVKSINDAIKEQFKSADYKSELKFDIKDGKFELQTSEGKIIDLEQLKKFEFNGDIENYYKTLGVPESVLKDFKEPLTKYKELYQQTPFYKLEVLRREISKTADSLEKIHGTPTNEAEFQNILENSQELQEKVNSVNAGYSSEDGIKPEGVPMDEVKQVIDLNNQMNDLQREMQRLQDLSDLKKAADAEPEGSPKRERLNRDAENITKPGDPKTLEDLKNKNEKLEKKIKELQDKIDEKTKYGPNEKSWADFIKENVGSLVKYGLIGLAGLTWYNAIKRHQDEMNGCWIINTKSGDQTKVGVLTCKKADLINATTYPSINSSCTQLCGKGPEGCFVPNRCIKCGADPQDLAKDCKMLQSACDNNANNCSDYCNDDMLGIPSGYTLKCVNATFWQAFADFVGGPFDLAGGLLKKIIKILLYIFLAVIIIIAMYFLIKFLFFRNPKNSQKKIQIISVTPKRAQMKKIKK